MQTRTAIRIVLALIALAFILPTLVRGYQAAESWSHRAGNQASCAYAQQADLLAGHDPRTCKP